MSKNFVGTLNPPESTETLDATLRFVASVSNTDSNLIAGSISEFPVVDSEYDFTAVDGNYKVYVQFTGETEWRRLALSFDVNSGLDDDLLVALEAQGASLPADVLTKVPFTTKTANYELTLSDAGTMVRMNVASANTVTIPPNSTAAFDLGTIIAIRQVGAGDTTLVAGSGVTINQPAGKSLTVFERGYSISIHKVGTNTWDLEGSLTDL